MRFFLLMASLLMTVVTSFASVKDLFFFESGGRSCVRELYGSKAMDAEGISCQDPLRHDMRVRVINGEENSSQKLGFDLVRPFLIVDGIYLDTKAERTLSEFQDEIDQIGLSTLLSDLGYTPVLIQFSETVDRSLKQNATFFADWLKFVNRNRLFGFANRSADGFIVMGISQGGVIGRYGAYQYDIGRSSSDAPVRLFASLDSPHQGAVIPKSLLYTVNFWAEKGGSDEAETIKDLLGGSGVKDLLIMKSQTSNGNLSYKEDFSSQRFLFGEYRKAAEYKGFPSVLISQGLLNGKAASRADKFFKLNRKAEKFGTVMGRAESHLYAPGKDSSTLSYNRVYKKAGQDKRNEPKGSAKYDFVQGSSYPFAEIMYKNLRKGMLKALPKNMQEKIFLGAHISLNTSWDDDSLYQATSTFIPSVSALDMKCSGKIALEKDCAFSQTSSGINFEKPGNLSGAKAIYGVDPAHPRYKDGRGLRHIELPVKSGRMDTLVLRGLQTDVWRILCEVAKMDYDSVGGEFKNPYLTEHFAPGASCLDNSKIPAIIKNAGLAQTKKFPYARYDYKASATEKSNSVSFDVAAGWHRVAWFDNGVDIPEGSIFEVDVKVENSKNNWMRGEVLLHKRKNDSNQLQLTEVDVPVDGKKHTLRWKMPFSRNAPASYRWIRLILNSDGGRVVLSNPRLVVSGIEMPEPESIASAKIYPNSAYHISPWTTSTQVLVDTNTTWPRVGLFLRIDFKSAERGLHVMFDGIRSLRPYTQLKVVYVPGTCQETAVYLDSYRAGAYSLANGTLSGSYRTVSVPLNEIIDTRITPNFGLSANRLSILGLKANETCVIKEISLQ